MDSMGTFGWAAGLGFFFMILIWALIILGIVALVKWISAGMTNNNPSNNSARPSKTALEILEERYARGEIEREEFEQKKRDLES